MDLTALVPDGYTHRSTLITRGWTASMVDTQLGEHALKITGVPDGVSNKVYPDIEIARVEETVTAVRRAVHARDEVIPSVGPYDHDSTVSRSHLIGRGWTDTHVRRLLLHPDLIEGESYRYGLNRVRQAESTDAKLIARLAKMSATATAAKEDRIAAVVASNRGVWRRVDGAWLVQVRDVKVGDRLEVARRDGTTEEKIVTGITRTLTDGSILASVTNPPRQPEQAAPQPGTETTPTAAPRAPQPAAAPRVMVLPYPTAPGQSLRFGRQIITILTSEPHRIHEDDPSLYGSHLLGEEGKKGSRITYRPATTDEAAPLQAQEEAEQAEQAQLRRQAAALSALVRHCQAVGETPRDGDPTRGTLILDHLDPHGGGVQVRTDGPTLILVEGNGGDGDHWAHNNAPGMIVRQAPITMTVHALLADLKESR